MSKNWSGYEGFAVDDLPDDHIHDIRNWHLEQSASYLNEMVECNFREDFDRAHDSLDMATHHAVKVRGITTEIRRRDYLVWLRDHPRPTDRPAIDNEERIEKIRQALIKKNANID